MNTSTIELPAAEEGKNTKGALKETESTVRGALGHLELDAAQPRREKPRRSPESMIPPELKECFEKIRILSEKYDVGIFCDAEKLKNTNNAEIQSAIDKIQGTHSEVVAEMKVILKENKEALKKYMTELKNHAGSKEKDGVGFISAFIGLQENNGTVSFSYMNKNDISQTLWGIADGIKDSSLIWRISKMGLGILPVTAEVQDAVNAYTAFSRGHVKEGVINLGLFALDAAIDVGALLATAGTAPAAGVGGAAVEIAGAGVRGIVKKLMRSLARSAVKGVKAERIASMVRGTKYLEQFKHNTGWLLKGLRKNNQPLVLPSNKLKEGIAGLPRSESIKIDNL